MGMSPLKIFDARKIFPVFCSGDQNPEMVTPGLFLNKGYVGSRIAPFPTPTREDVALNTEEW
jgi:hypothetical protein